MVVLVRLNRDISDSIITQLNSRKIIIKEILSVLPILILDIQNLNELVDFDFIQRIELNELFSTQTIEPVPNWDSFDVDILKRHEYTGSNANVGVIDTGIDKNKIIVHHNEVFSDSSHNGCSSNEQKGHGTFVASIIKHVAPWSQLYNLKVCNDNGDLPRDAILKAFEYALINNIRIINISLAIPQDCDPDCLVCEAVNLRASKGFITIASVGNFALTHGQGITGCPGNARSAYTVGSADDSGEKQANFSSTAKNGISKPNILAPGSFLISKTHIWGTSFSAPFITGIITSLSSRYGFERIIGALEATADDLSLPRNVQGCGLVNIERLLEVLENGESVS